MYPIPWIIIAQHRITECHRWFSEILSVWGHILSRSVKCSAHTSCRTRCVLSSVPLLCTGPGSPAFGKLQGWVSPGLCVRVERAAIPVFLPLYSTTSDDNSSGHNSNNNFISSSSTPSCSSYFFILFVFISQFWKAYYSPLMSSSFQESPIIAVFDNCELCCSVLI